MRLALDAKRRVESRSCAVIDTPFQRIASSDPCCRLGLATDSGASLVRLAVRLRGTWHECSAWVGKAST